MTFQYGYVKTINGESRRIVLGHVDSSQYAEKKREIDDANFISSGGLGHPPDKNTVWFIEETIM